jgi:hypothetical protein
MATTRSVPDVVTLSVPRPGSVVGLAAGSRLRLRLRSGLSRNRWDLVAQPGNLVPLVRDESELSFLVFDGAPATLRLERRHARSGLREVCELRIEVLEVEEVGGAGRRSA